MIWIDGDKWPPDLHGTGSEDYFNQAWGMQPNAYLFNGSALYEGDVRGYQVSYNFHLTNPVHFRKSVLVSMEHGHANHLGNEWASTAYWYQLEPHRRFDILPVEQRLPIRTDLGVVPASPEKTPRVRLSQDMRRSRAAEEKLARKQERSRQADARKRAAMERRWVAEELKKARQDKQKR